MSSAALALNFFRVPESPEPMRYFVSQIGLLPDYKIAGSIFFYFRTFFEPFTSFFALQSLIFPSSAQFTAPNIAGFCVSSPGQLQKPPLTNPFRFFPHRKLYQEWTSDNLLKWCSTFVRVDYDQSFFSFKQSLN
ncbi:MAG: hypothetical protein U0Y68_01625 [Blastocatellia bacterium]